MSMADRRSQHSSSEDAKLSRMQWKMVFTAGMGFFTDAYDLFVIGIVTAILAPIWHLTTQQLALLNGASLAAAALGATLFGSLADKFGRKKMYGFEVLILFIGAILSALSTSFSWLLVSRVIVGFGIGGDYPSSAVVASEYAGRKNRGYLVLLVFAMQAVGLVVGPLFAALLLSSNISPHWIWRILLGIGAIPAASVFYLRRTIQETPQYLLTKQMPYEVSRVISDLTGHKDIDATRLNSGPSLWSGKWLWCFVGTAGAWFLLDVAFYGNGVSSVLIINQLIPHATLLQHTLVSTVIFTCFAVPGYFLSAKFIDRIGRKVLQILGFFVMSVCYLAIAFLPSIMNHTWLFLATFGVSFFFVNFGPNATTFLIPSEIYPTNIRAKAHGLSAAIGKVGAFVGVFLLPIVLRSYGLTFTLALMALVSFLGIMVTFLIPEMKNIPLEEIYPIKKTTTTQAQSKYAFITE